MPSLTVRTCDLQGPEITNVKVWIDSDPEPHYSPVTVTLAGGTHTVEVESHFWTGWFEHTFLHWEDDSTDNPRSVYVNRNMTITAYYNVTYHGTCPTLFVWNGSAHVYEALLDIHAESDIAYFIFEINGHNGKIP